jgi:predicted nucleic acid-binding protein
VILVDTSIWIDHLRVGDPKLAALLQDGHVLAHPWVIGELALGQLSDRSEILRLLHNLPHAQTATDAEVLNLVDNRHLFQLGLANHEEPTP